MKTKLFKGLLVTLLLGLALPLASCGGEDSSSTPEPAVHVHTIELVKGKQSTCAEEGWCAHYECTVCHKFFADKEGTREFTRDDVIIAKKDHSLVPVTNEAGEVTHYHCTSCEQDFKDEAGTELVK